MSDMFIPKKEKIKIILESVIYVALVIVASYFTIFGDTFVRMIPMIYFIGILGNMMFNKSAVTLVLTSISVFVFGYMSENAINTNIILFVIYSASMLGFGIVTGYILNTLYENFKLRKFIKYYTKMAYIITLVLVILIPLLMNNLVNSNMIIYSIAKSRVDKYVRENYAYSEYYVTKGTYIPSYQIGAYEFDIVIDGTKVKLNYMLNNEIADVNMNERKETLNNMLKAELNILLKQNSLQILDVTGSYDYSKIATTPDSINISISNLSEKEIDYAVSFISVLKKWSKFDKLDRINIDVDGKAVIIDKDDLNNKDITKEYILKGTEYEILDSKEGI